MPTQQGKSIVIENSIEGVGLKEEECNDASTLSQQSTQGGVDSFPYFSKI